MAGEWRQKYGPVVGFITATQNIVAICGPHEVLEVLHREEFQARPIHKFFYDRSFGKRLGNGTFALFILTGTNILVCLYICIALVPNFKSSGSLRTAFVRVFEKL
jgi:hypothetical protein